jgi:hypothetical protein
VNTLEIRANDAESKLDNLENSMTNMNIRLGDVESEINNYVRPQIYMFENLVGEHDVQIADLDSQVNNLNSQLQGVLNLFHPIHSGSYRPIFTDGGTDREASYVISWYNLHRFDSGHGGGFKYVLVIVRGFYLNLPLNGA